MKSMLIDKFRPQPFFVSRCLIPALAFSFLSVVAEAQTELQPSRAFESFAIRPGANFALVRVVSVETQPAEVIARFVRNNPGIDPDKAMYKLGGTLNVLTVFGGGTGPDAFSIRMPFARLGAPRTATRPIPIAYLRVGEQWLIEFDVPTRAVSDEALSRACRVSGVGDPLVLACVRYCAWTNSPNVQVAFEEAGRTLQDARSHLFQRLAACAFMERAIAADTTDLNLNRFYRREQQEIHSCLKQESLPPYLEFLLVSLLRLSSDPSDPMSHAERSEFVGGLLSLMSASKNPNTAPEIAGKLAGFATELVPVDGELRVFYWPEILDALETYVSTHEGEAASSVAGILQALERKGRRYVYQFKDPHVVMKL